jgi:peptidoglycan/xylan/chitin deacetylase (PgdA/CDA1 family)
MVHRMHTLIVAVCVAACVGAGVAVAAECTGNPDAIGTSRTVYVDSAEHPRVGTMQYHETLPLDDHEVVLTFDDGPLPPKSTHVLDILASECVKATFFSVGRMAQEFPAVLRRAYAEGHSIGTHSQNHPYNIRHAPLSTVQDEVDTGITSVASALADPKDVAPFFRIPGLERQDDIDDFVNSRGLMLWSADFVADDWKHIRPSDVLHRALKRIEAKHKGILLLHDIQPATVAALPQLLKELKRRGYRIVHVAPATPEQPKTITEPSQWLMSSAQPASEAVNIETPLELRAAITSPQLPSSNATAPSPGLPNPNATSASAASPSAQRLGTPSSGVPDSSVDSARPPAGDQDHAILRGAVPLPPERPRSLTERATGQRTARVHVVLPGTYVGHAGVLPPGVPEQPPPELTTGSIAPPPPKARNELHDGEIVLRPSAEVPSAPAATMNVQRDATP